MRQCDATPASWVLRPADNPSAIINDIDVKRPGTPSHSRPASGAPLQLFGRAEQTDKRGVGKTVSNQIRKKFLTYRAVWPCQVDFRHTTVTQSRLMKFIERPDQALIRLAPSATLIGAETEDCGYHEPPP